MKTEEKNVIEQALNSCSAETTDEVMTRLLIDTDTPTYSMFRDLRNAYIEANDEFRAGIDKALTILTKNTLVQIAQEILATETEKKKAAAKNELKIKEARAVYTGGNIWAFSGETRGDKVYFLTSDDGWTLLLNEDPAENWDECGYPEWQQAHLIRELEGAELNEFNAQLLNVLKGYGLNDERRGGIFDEELDGYKTYWHEEG